MKLTIHQLRAIRDRVEKRADLARRYDYALIEAEQDRADLLAYIDYMTQAAREQKRRERRKTCP